MARVEIAYVGEGDRGSYVLQPFEERYAVFGSEEGISTFDFFFFILIFVSLLGEFLFFIFVLCLCLFVFFLFAQRKRDCFPKRLFMVHTIKNKL